MIINEKYSKDLLLFYYAKRPAPGKLGNAPPGGRGRSLVFPIKVQLSSLVPWRDTYAIGHTYILRQTRHE